MTNAPISLSVRGFQLASILDSRHGDTQLILKVLDLENELVAAKESLLVFHKQQSQDADKFAYLLSTIEVEEFADADSRLKNPPDEKTWIETLCHKTGFDVRAILSDLPTELGLFCLKVAYKSKDELAFATIEVWVVAA